MPNAALRVYVDNGISYVWDRGRNKILSSREYAKFSIKHKAVKNQWMRMEDGLPSMAVGEPMIRKGTITGLIAHCASPHTWTLQVFKKGSTTALVSEIIVNSTKLFRPYLDIDFDEGDVLQCFAAGVNIPFPRGMVEIAWRL